MDGGVAPSLPLHHFDRPLCYWLPSPFPPALLSCWQWLHLPAFPQGVKRLLGIQQAGWEGTGEGEEAGSDAEWIQ